MARTSGHGNPNWTRDEVILALDLLFHAGDALPGDRDPRVIQLSQLLQRSPLHPMSARKESFRNPEGVAFKLQNLRQVGTGAGLKHTSAVDRAVWREFGESPLRVAELARQIEREITRSDDADADEFEGLEFSEGRLLTRAHRRRERNRNLRKRLIQSRRKRGALVCEGCGLQGPTGSAQLEETIFEVHHLVPIAEAGEGNTRLRDTALLCANCHRLIHGIISQSKSWANIDDLRSVISHKLLPGGE